MARRDPDYLPRKINNRVPSMAYAAAPINSGDYMVHFGTPPTADPDFLITGRLVTTTAAFTYTSSSIANDGEVAHPYGVCIQVKFQGSVTQAIDRSLTAKGRDYLGQPMEETKALSGATGANISVIFGKAFKWVDELSLTSGTVLASAGLEVGFGDVLGLPYKCIGVGIEVIDNDKTTGGTIVEGSDATQTATTADPRGIYTPSASPNGSRNIKLETFVDRSNLHGLAHYHS